MIGVTFMDAAFDRDEKKSRCGTSTSSPYRNRTTTFESMREMP